MSTSVSSTSSSILSCSASVTSSYIMQKIIRSTSPNTCGCISPPTSQVSAPSVVTAAAVVASPNQNVSSSGPSTITNNSPTISNGTNSATACYPYLTDLSNTPTINGVQVASSPGGVVTSTNGISRSHNHFIHQVDINIDRRFKLSLNYQSNLNK